MPQRLQKYIASSGLASRRKAEELISAGKVKVNGKLINTPGFLVGEGDEVFLNGQLVKPASQLVYYVLNKPRGVVTTSKDEQGRKTVIDLVPNNPVVVACGRLDAASRGLVLLTNDGEVCYQITHPKFGHQKEYQVVATINSGPPIEERIDRLCESFDIDGYQTLPAKVSAVKRKGMELSFNITLAEGRNRQIRRMCSAVGLDVVDLCRTKIDKLTLFPTLEGQWRRIKREEIV